MRKKSGKHRGNGYSCYPEPPYDNTFNVRYNSSECFDYARAPSAERFCPSQLETFELSERKANPCTLNPKPSTLIAIKLS